MINRVLLFFIFVYGAFLLSAYQVKTNVDECEHLQVAFELSGKPQNNSESIQDFVNDLVFFEYNGYDGRFIFIRSGEEISVPSLEVNYSINKDGNPENISRLSLGPQSARAVQSDYAKCWE